MSHLLEKSSPPVARRTRWRKAMWLAFIFVIAAGTLGLWAFSYSNSELRQAVADAAKDDPHWRFIDVEAHRAQVPDEQNSALVFTAGHRLINRGQWTTQMQSWDDLVSDFSKYPRHRLNEEQKEALDGVLKPYGPALVEYRKAKDLPNGRYPLAITPDLISILLPHVQSARDACRILRYDVYSHLESGDTASAADSLIAGINAGRSIGDESILISALVRFACDAVILTAFERFLAQTEADDANLARLQAAIEQEVKEPIFLNAMRGERGFGFGYLEYLRENPSKSGGLRMASLNGTGGSSLAISLEEWMVYVPGVVAHSQADILRYMNEGVAIARRPYEEQTAAFAEWNKKSKDLTFLTRQLAPSVGGVSSAALRHQASLRCMQVAIAGERYRLKNQKWPEKLDDLVLAKLISAVPLDPFDGKPLRWKVVDDGRIIYSIGKDLTDNDGTLNRDNPNKDGSDVGYQLFDVNKRRQPPRAPKPKEGAINDPPYTPPGQEP